MRALLRATSFLLLLLCAQPAFAQAPTDDVGLDDRTGTQLPLELPFVDQDGRATTLGQVLGGEVPTLLVLAYYECPMLCGLVLQGAAQAVGRLDGTVGERFRVVTVSFDPNDTPVRATKKRQSVVASLGSRIGPTQWPFLVGDAGAIRTLSGALGFRARWDERTKQFAHPAALFVVSPSGRLSRVLTGVDFAQRDVQLALLEAGEGRSAPLLERFVLTCFRYDPATRRYGPFVFGFLRTGAALVAVALGLGLWRLRRRERAERGEA